MRIGRAHDLPLVGDPATVEYRRSVWLVECGPFRLARHRSVRRVVEPAPPPAPSGFAPRTVGAIAVVLAVAAPICLIQARTLAGAPYVVSQSVPDKARLPVASAAPRFRRAHPRPAAPAAAPIAAAVLATGDVLSGDQALAAAWLTGEPQEWSEGGAHGMVVPGALERNGGFVCRSFARLTRHPGEPDAVEQSHRCSAITGAAPAEAKGD